MDINEEAQNVVMTKQIEERAREKQIEEDNAVHRSERALKSEILKAKRPGLIKAYKLARTHQMWEESHDLLMEIMREYYETVQVDIEAEISEILYRWPR